MRKVTILIIILFSLVLPLFAFDGFADIFDQPAEVTSIAAPDKSGFDIAGLVNFSLGSFINPSDFRSAAIEIGGGLDLDFSWRGSIVDAKASFSLQPSIENDLHWSDIFTGLSITTYFPEGRIEVGLLKKEWGSGDGVHVVDVVNAPDYRKGIVDDPLAMKVAEPMLYTTISWSNSSVELFYKPILILMASDEDPTGRWAMIPEDGFLNLVPPPLTVELQDRQIPTLKELTTLSKYQFGGRYKQIAGPFDLGVIYYNGFHYQPSYYVNNITPGATPADPITLDLDVGYTRAQLFGLEATFVTGPLTFMAEGGFWLSEDARNTQVSKFNNRWVYLAGVGILIPGTSIYASATYNGHYIMDFEEFAFAPGTTDIPVDTLQALFSSDGKGYLNTFTAAMEVPLAREKVLVRLAGTYQMETKGYSLLPSVKWHINDDLVFKTSGRVFGSFDGGSPSIFKNWKDNSSVKLELAYLF